METTVVIQFHPQFLTKVDRAFKVQCFYMEADKTVATDLDVRLIILQKVRLIKALLQCSYNNLANGDIPHASVYIHYTRRLARRTTGALQRRWPEDLPQVDVR